ncbi:hypothetical protein EV193_110120 [Herbihabitans rhizosphaerae]|uniref:Uncharacterized protein n=1 Tax=Herbihabitans rhizosphaerae TaxID=1872711 RepID=A0A4Q7KGJ8_9PSEU|nr:hypothetical protein EV193_110120 [Herbihabitans rhizosphaerae]
MLRYKEMVTPRLLPTIRHAVKASVPPSDGRSGVTAAELDRLALIR